MNAVVRVVQGRPFRKHRESEVLRAEFRGDVIVSAYDPAGRTGGVVVFPLAKADEELKRLAEAIRSEAEGALSRWQFKAVGPKSGGEKLKAAASLAGLTLSTLALFAENDAQELFFYPGSGRLRAAPLATPAEASKATDRPKVISSQAKPAVSSVPAAKTRVLIVDDSKTMRQMLRKILSSDPRLEVVGEAELPSQVEALIAKTKPDVMTLDINMPEMTGVELLRTLLPKRFIPTVMISALSLHEGEEVMTALELGAVDYIQKPQANEMETVVPLIIEKITEAARARRPRKASTKKITGPATVTATGSFGETRLLAVGASTGGTEAIKSVFTCLPENVPPIAVVQHIPPYFSMAFANRLNELCRFEVREAKDGDEFLPGLALVAPGGLHMEVVKKGGRVFARVFDADPVNRFKPSVDVLFRSVAKEFGRAATGLLMTGMGSDGAKGLLEMRNSGAHTIAQDEESCVVFGMPRAAIELGAACQITSLDDIAQTLIQMKKAA